MTNSTSAPTVKLGDELTVSAIGFGAMALTPVYGEVNDDDSLATLNRTVDLGVTFIDTANIYGNGNNEKLISKLLADRRDEVTLATKFGILGNHADRAAGRMGATGFKITGGVSSKRKTRSELAMADWRMLYFSLISAIGRKKR